MPLELGARLESLSDPFAAAWSAGGRFGEWFVARILELAALLTGEGAPGAVSLLLLVALFLVSLRYWWTVRRFRIAIRSAREVFAEWKGSKFTGAAVLKIDRSFHAFGSRPGPWRRLATAWTEFRETTVDPDPELKTGSLRNTARPDAFFSREELGMEHRMWRQIPGLFVSVGLLLTFFGLVAALEQTSRILDSAANDSNVTEGLKTLLRIAGAKFIMSLTGLFSSIAFTLLLRLIGNRLDRDLRALCAAIEDGCDFLSEQSVLREMLEQSREQTARLQAFGTELVAQIARPLREDLPQAIGTAVEKAMEPVARDISRGTGEGMAAVAGEVGDRLAGGVQEAVDAMNRTIGEVRSSLETVADRLDRSSGTMSGRVDEAVEALAGQIGELETRMALASATTAKALVEGSETLLQRMNETLEAIRTNTAEGAKRIEAASRAMAEAAAGLSQTVHATLADAADTSGREIAAAGETMAAAIAASTERIDRNLIGSMNELVERIDGLGERVTSASTRLERHAGAVERSAEIVELSNMGLGRSAEAMAAAAAPMHGAANRVETAAQTMSERVEEASRAMANTAEHTREILGGAAAAIESSQSAVKQSLESLQRAVEDFGRIVSHYDAIDRGLGAAFEKIDRAVRSSVEEIGKFNTELNKEFGDALNRLAGVIAQAEPFLPRGTD